MLDDEVAIDKEQNITDFGAGYLVIIPTGSDCMALINDCSQSMIEKRTYGH
jgi:hypothetical protein